MPIVRVARLTDIATCGSSTHVYLVYRRSLSLFLSLLLLWQERLGKGGVDGHSQFIFEHVAPACGNLCRALGEDFAMFLPVVLPPLFAALEEEVKFSMEAADPDDDGEVRRRVSSTALL